VASDRRASNRRPPWALGLVLAAAVTFGIVAVLLSGTPPSVPSTGGTATSSPLLVPYLWVGLGCLVLLVCWIGYMVYRRLTGGSGEYPRYTLLSLIAIILVILLILFLFRVVAHVDGLVGVRPSPSNNSSGSGGSGTGTQHNTTTATNGSANYTLQGELPGLPKWAPYAVLGVAVLTVTLIAIPFLLSYGERSELSRREEPGPEPVRAALRSTLSELESNPQADPRDLIIALYARLLEAIGVGAGPTEVMTAREIERVCVQSLGVRPTTARELTGLFEEARYSTRPMGAPAADRARRALSEALRELSGPRRLG